MQPKAPNLEILIRALTSEQVQFVLIGGFAVILHGGRNTTMMDSDFAVAADPDNVRALVRALAPLDPRPWHSHEGVPFVWDEHSIDGSYVSLQTSAGDVDLHLETPGVDSFDGLLQRSVEMRLDDVSFRIASINDLVDMKRKAARPQDLAHLAELARIGLVSD